MLLLVSSVIDRSEPSSAASLVTRDGAPAAWDPAVAFSLSRIHSYLSLGVPSETVREIILSEPLARSIGRDGRALVADVLDYGREVVEQKHARRQSRRRFFRALMALDRLLSKRGKPYFVYANFDWDSDFEAVDEVRFDTLAIVRTRRFRVSGFEPVHHGEPAGVLRALHVVRVGAAHTHRDKLGFTAPDYDDVFILPDRVTEELENILPALDPDDYTPLFEVSTDDGKAPWYARFRGRVAQVMAEDLGGAVEPMDGRALAALMDAVEIHELQHQIDYKRRPAVHGVFRDVAARTADMRLASACMYETSAHLGQMARDRVFPRFVLAEITSYAFVGRCQEADCLAALVILDELATELGHPQPERLLTQPGYDLSAIAERYLAIAGHPSTEVAAAAERTWTRLFRAPLAEIEPIDAPASAEP